MCSEKRRTLSLKVELPNLESLRDLSAELTTIPKSDFVFKYDDILDLLWEKLRLNESVVVEWHCGRR